MTDNEILELLESDGYNDGIERYVVVHVRHDGPAPLLVVRLIDPETGEEQRAKWGLTRW